MHSQQLEFDFSAKKFWEEKWYEEWLKLSRRDYMKGREVPLHGYENVQPKKDSNL